MRPAAPASPQSQPKKRMNSLLAAVEVASSPSTNTNAKSEPRKGARVFNADEKLILEAEYKLNKFPTRSMITDFGVKLDKPIEKIRTWFNNRRALDRKQGIDVQRLPNTPRTNTNTVNPHVNTNINTTTPAPVPTLHYIQQQQALQQERILRHQQQQQQQQAQQAQMQANAFQAAAKLEITASPASPSPTSPPTPPPTISSSVGLTTSILPLPPLTQSHEEDVQDEPTIHTHLPLNNSDIKLRQQQRAVSSKQKLSAVKQPIPPIALMPETPRNTPRKSSTSSVMNSALAGTASSPVANMSRRMSNVTPISAALGLAATPSRATPTPLRSAGRSRLTPVRLRSARLRLGDSELRGEGYAEDVGLEVKFLFGKKRLVYEWYCGENYADTAKITGGPYAKMETNFDSLYSMRFVRTRDGSIIEMTLSDTPALYLQSENNMHKYKSRSQQRQYQKADEKQFENIDVAAKDHCIHLRSDEAARVRKTILESVPELAALVHESTPGNSQFGASPTGGFDIPGFSNNNNNNNNSNDNDRLTDSESNTAATRTDALMAGSQRKLDFSSAAANGNNNNNGNLGAGRRPESLDITSGMLGTPRPQKSPSEPSSYKSDVVVTSVAARHVSSSSSPGALVKSYSNTNTVSRATNTPMNNTASHVWETPTRSNMKISRKRSAEQALGTAAMNAPTTSGPSNAAYLIPTPGPWHSPGTPLTSDIRTMSNSHNINNAVSLWPAMNNTPMSDNTATATPMQVRRALNFGKDGNNGEGMLLGRKRSLDLSSEDNNNSDGNGNGKLGGPAKRKKLSQSSTGSVVPQQPPPMPLPPVLPPIPPLLPGQELTTKENSNTNDCTTDCDTVEGMTIEGQKDSCVNNNELVVDMAVEENCKTRDALV